MILFVSSDEQKSKLAMALCREGFDRKACAALIAGEVCEENAETNSNQSNKAQGPAPNAIVVYKGPSGLLRPLYAPTRAFNINGAHVELEQGDVGKCGKE